jgi:threonylcarbamoyladenosine tRNA methylthiotransferase MtaB
MRVAVQTFGCRLNQAESERMAADFAAAGCRVVPASAAAEVVVIHGCAVTQVAAQESRQAARRAKRRAQAAGRPEPLVVLVGCVVEADGRVPVVPEVDLLVSREEKERLAPLVLARLGQEGAPVAVSAAPARRRTRALLKVQDGCNFGCAYCIVPHTRGAPVSRPWQQVLDEARARAAAGFSEIVVTGCNLACYRDGSRGLVELLAALAELPEAPRIRLGSIEPATVEREVVGLMAGSGRICHFLHLPLQSGDGGVLRRMGRRYTPEAYYETVQALLHRLPRLGLGTDLLTGFPGETPEAFERTRELFGALPFSKVHVFPYSERPGTPAAAFADAVPPPLRKARARALTRLGAAGREAYARQWIGRPVELLIEGVDAAGNGHGWSGEYLACRVAGVAPEARGQILSFTPQDVAPGGVLLGAGAQPVSPRRMRSSSHE